MFYPQLVYFITKGFNTWDFFPYFANDVCCLEIKDFNLLDIMVYFECLFFAFSKVGVYLRRSLPLNERA